MRSFADVRAAVGGIKGLMRKLGDAPAHERHWKSMERCPFCGEKGCAGVFEKGGVEFFKCHHTSCSSSGTVMSKVGYVAARKGLSDTKPADGGASPAYEFLLRLVGMWEERPERPEPERPAETAETAEPKAENEQDEREDETLIATATTLIA